MTSASVLVLYDRCETVHVVEVHLGDLVLVVVHGVDTRGLLDVVLVYLLKNRFFYLDLTQDYNVL